MCNQLAGQPMFCLIAARHRAHKYSRSAASGPLERNVSLEAAHRLGPPRPTRGGTSRAVVCRGWYLREGKRMVSLRSTHPASEVERSLRASSLEPEAWWGDCVGRSASERPPSTDMVAAKVGSECPYWL